MAGMLDRDSQSPLMHGAKTIAESADDLTPVGNKFLKRCDV